MTTPETVEAMRRFRRLLDEREATTMQAMARRWIELERALADQLALLAQEVAARQAAGLPVSADLVRLMGRYQALQRQALVELSQFAGFAAARIAGEQRWVAAAGIEHGAALLRAATGVRGGFDVLPVEALARMAGYVADGSPLRQYFARMYPTAMQGIMDALFEGLARGLGPGQIARRMREGMGVAARTAINSARTETLRVYREASLAQYRASGLVDGYVRVAAKSERTCMACLAKDGEWFPLDVSFEEHNQGRCRPIPARRGAVFPGKQGLAWFREQSPEVQRRMLGAGRFDAWKGGKFDLEDVAKLHVDTVWGNSWQERGLKELLGGGFGPQGPAPQPPTPPRGPAGTPVSAALRGPSSGMYAERYNRTLRAIDGVHGDGVLPEIPIKTATSKHSSRNGSFRFGGGQALDIEINGANKDLEATLVHEVGHFIDFAGFGGGKLATRSSFGLLDGWRESVEASAAVRGLRERLEAPHRFRTMQTMGSYTYGVTPDRNHVRYLLDPAELWARSYAQYIALRSGDPLLKQQIENVFEDQVYGSRQWGWDDFEPVARAIDALFVRLGWLR